MRRLFAFLSASSLLLCVATCAMWVRSYLTCDEVMITGDREIDLQTVRGGLLVVHESKFAGQNGNYNYRNVTPGDRLWLGHKNTSNEVSTWTIEQFHRPAKLHSPLRSVLGFSWSFEDWTRPEGRFHRVRGMRRALQIPCWALTSLFALAPSLYFRTRYFHKPDGSRTCLVCGYDLRATPNRCPDAAWFRPSRTEEYDLRPESPKVRASHRPRVEKPCHGTSAYQSQICAGSGVTSPHPPPRSSNPARNLAAAALRPDGGAC
jgi:hypothetical protein